MIGGNISLRWRVLRCLIIVRVRHDVVDVAVMPLEYGHYLPFRWQVPTGTCVVGNDEVRSFRDNGTSSFGKAARA
jgi:hypothetical protein